jgi:hypothetical protein
MMPFSLSSETNQDSEPFLAAHPTNSNLLTASAFTPNPAGSSSTTAPVYISQDGGNTWVLNAILPSPVETADITESYDETGVPMIAGILNRSDISLDELTATDPTAPTTMTVTGSRGNVDQPFVKVTPAPGARNVLLGINDFNAAPKTATTDLSTDGGATWNSIRLEARNTSGQNGPSIRPTVAKDGRAYVAFFGWRAFNGSTATSDVVVVRDDNSGVGANPFHALTGADGLSGQIVAAGVTIPWSNAPTLGQERIGSTLSIAADPNNSGAVYIAWGDRVGNGDIYTIHVRSSTDRGATWSGDLRALTNTTNAALAIAENGTVGLLYQQVVNNAGINRWVTHLEQTSDGFVHIQDMVLANVPADAPAPEFLPYIGDYNYLLVRNNAFIGVFSANNTPDLANFPQGVQYQRNANFATKQLLDGAGSPVAVSIDPFFFRVPVSQ